MFTFISPRGSCSYLFNFFVGNDLFDSFIPVLSSFPSIIVSFSFFGRMLSYDIWRINRTGGP